jgi:crotonobetainyl-CoA:carnitine CoA-transferase CaiB-like acyl-CoA transferase
VLKGVRVLSLALNLPGPAALQRLRDMGARCTKVEPPGGDPMALYSPQAYTELHRGIRTATLDLKAPAGQQALHRRLARTDVLLTSFRPTALKRLGLDWPSLQTRHPELNCVLIVGAPAPRSDEPGHDLTYVAEHDLVQGLELPATLYADMAGAMAASEAALQCLLLHRRDGKGHCVTVALSDAAGWLAAPRRWKLTTPEGDVGGAHAGYRVYACRDGRVAVAALEPHFARALLDAAGLPGELASHGMHAPQTHDSLAAFFLQHTRQQLTEVARTHDLPLHPLA